MNIYYVYGLFEYCNDLPFYIGKGKSDRLNQHAAKARQKEGDRYDLPVYRKIRKINYKFDALKFFEGLSEEDAHDIEIFLIKKYGKKTDGNGILYNISDGGDGLSGRVMPEDEREWRKKRYSGKGNPMYGMRGKLSPLYGKPSAMTGRNHSEETKSKMREAHSGRKIHPNTLKGLYENNPMHNEETRKYHAQRMASEDVRDNKSNAVKGEKNPMYGKKQKTLYCPHCGKSGGNGAFVRWHMDNCRHKNA